MLKTKSAAHIKLYFAGELGAIILNWNNLPSIDLLVPQFLSLSHGRKAKKIKYWLLSFLENLTLLIGLFLLFGSILGPQDSQLYCLEKQMVIFG